MKKLKNIILFIICLMAGCGEIVMAQAPPVNPVKQNTNATYLEPSTNNMWGSVGNGAALGWRQWVDSVSLYTKSHNWIATQKFTNANLLITDGGNTINSYYTPQGFKLGFGIDDTHNYIGMSQSGVILDNGTNSFLVGYRYLSGTAALLSDIPTSLPPSGAAGGALNGTYPNPGLNNIAESQVTNLTSDLAARELLANKVITLDSSVNHYASTSATTRFIDSVAATKITYLTPPSDTTQDSYTLIQNAVNNLNGKGTVYLKKGIYYLNNPARLGIRLPASAIGIRIIGEGGTIIKLSRNNLRAFDFSPPTDSSKFALYQNIELGNFNINNDNISSSTIATPVVAASSATGTGSSYVDVNVGSNTGFINGGLCFFPYTNTGTAVGKQRALRLKSGSTTTVQILLAAGETVAIGDTVKGCINDSFMGNNFSNGAVVQPYNVSVNNISIHNVDIINVPGSEPNPTVTGLTNHSSTERQGIDIISKTAGSNGVSGGYSGQLYIKNVSIDHVRVFGGNVGILMYAVTPTKNSWFENINVSNCYWTGKTIPHNQYFCLGFEIGGTATGRDWQFNNDIGELSGDVIFENDNAINTIYNNCIGRNAFGGGGFFSTNYNAPAFSSAGALNTTVTGSVSSGATTITIAAFPAVATNGYLIIDNELMWYGYTGSTTLTVTRGLNQTAGVSHSNGATVTFVETDKQFVNYINCKYENTLLSGLAPISWGFSQQRNAYYPNAKFIGRNLNYLRVGTDIGSAGEAVSIQGNQNVDIDGLNVEVTGVNQTTTTVQQGRPLYFVNKDYDTGNGALSKVEPSLLRLKNITINASGILDNGGKSQYLGVYLDQGNWVIDWDLNVTNNFYSTGSNQAIGIGMQQGSTYVSGNVNLKYVANGGNSPIGILMQNFTPGTLNFNNLDFSGMQFLSPSTNANYKPWFLDLTTSASQHIFFGNVRHSIYATQTAAKIADKLITVTASVYTQNFTEGIIDVNYAGAETITLGAVEAGGSNSKLSYGYRVVINDISFAAGTNNITITPASGEKINNSTSSITINTNGGGYTLRAVPGGWIVEGINKALSDSKYAPISVTGTMTNISGVATNGFTWSIANPGTTPALTLALQNATTSQSGQLTSTDWNTFNGKASAATTLAGYGITDGVSLTGTQTLTNKTLTSPQINLGSDASGDLYYRNPSGIFSRVPVGSSGNVLTVIGGLPSWSPPSTNGTVTSITPGWSFTSTTPITTAGSLITDSTKVQTVGNFFTKGNTKYGQLTANNTWTGNNAFSATLALNGGANFGTNSANFTNAGNVLGVSAGTLTAARAVTWQDKSGAIALTTDIYAYITGTPTIVAGTGAGTSPTVSVTTNGKTLNVVVTTGTLPSGTSATIATVTFNTLPYSANPVFSPGNSNSAILSGTSMVSMSGSATTVTIQSGSIALTAGTTYVWNIAI